MRIKPRKIASNDDGTALVEAAIAIPLLVLMVAVIMQLALLFNCKQVVNYAAFCAARAAMVYGAADTTRVERAAELACVSVSYPITSDIQEVTGTISSLAGGDGGGLDLSGLSGLPGVGGVVDAVDRYVSSCIRTKVCSVQVKGGKVSATVIHHTKLIYPIGPLARIVTHDSRYIPPQVDQFGIEVPSEIRSFLNDVENLEDRIRGMAVPVASRCTLVM